MTVLTGPTIIGTAGAPPYEIPWDTRAEADGPCALVAQARTPDGRELTSERVTVTIDNTPPTVTLAAPRNGEAVGGMIRLEAAPRDAIGIAAVRFLVNGKAVGEAAVPPYRLDWDTRTLPNIPCALEARAFDRAGNDALSPAVTVKISNPSQRPSFEPIKSLTVLKGQPLALALQATDPDGARDPLTYRATGLPPWAKLDEKTGEVQGTPDPSEVSMGQPKKEYHVRFEVCDPERLCDHQETTITLVNHNDPPILSPIGDQTVKEGQTLAITLTASDPDGDPLTCKAGHLPPWAAFDPSTCTLQGVPPPDAATLASPKTPYEGVTFTVCDPEPLCVTEKLTITVVDVQNRAPVFDPIPDPVVDEGQPLKVAVHFHDPDGEAMDFRTGKLPEGSRLTRQGNDAALFEWTPRFDQSGIYRVDLTVTAGALARVHTMLVGVREKSLAISGEIIDVNTQRPLQGATVQLITGQGGAEELPVDADGRFLAKDLQPGVYQLRPHYTPKREFSTTTAGTFRATRFAPPSARVTITDRDVTGMEFLGYPP